MSARDRVSACFNFILEAYAHNFGSLSAAFEPRPEVPKSLYPFRSNPPPSVNARQHGAFHLTAARFGLLGLISRWNGVGEEEVDLRQFTRYLGLIQCVGIAQIANYTLQRIEEATALRAGCLQFEEDPRLGRIPLICGPTTKTDPDSDARWPTNLIVEPAIEALTVIANLRIKCAVANPRISLSHDQVAEPLLLERAHEPWAGGPTQDYGVHKKIRNYGGLLKLYPALFSTDQLRITEEDLRIARLLTPNLPETRFSVDSIWPLAWHQLRRTGAVNMFASGLVSDSSMQVLLKHRTWRASLYYGRGYTNLRLNEDARMTVAGTMYEVMGRSLREAASSRFVVPNAQRQETIVNLVEGKSLKVLTKAAREGKISIRETRLGFCAKEGSCAYGGVESISRCAGGEGGEPCNEACFDREKESRARDDLRRVNLSLSSCTKGSPRERTLLADKAGLTNYLRIIGACEG